MGDVACKGYFPSLRGWDAKQWRPLNLPDGVAWVVDASIHTFDIPSPSVST